MAELSLGAYEKLLTDQLARELANSELNISYRDIDEGEEPAILARHLGRLVEGALSSGTNVERKSLATNILDVLQRHTEQPYTDQSPQLHQKKMRHLTDITRHGSSKTQRPSTALADVALLTGSGQDEPAIGNELSAELATADRVDLIVAFIRWTGLRIMKTQLEALAERGVPFRVVTSTYMGSSEKIAIDRMVKRFGAEVKVNYSAASTKLHAKAWYFHRDSGFSTAYVGSSNLSHSALIDGLEWNVRLSEIITPQLLRKFEASFESLWQSEAYQLYDPDRDGEKLAESLQVNRYGGAQIEPDISGIDVRPYPHQVTMLEHLEAERTEHDRHRNLVVAATGTGKTVVAALDYRNLAYSGRLAPAHTLPRLLFIAHRKEILKQSRRTFREVLADGNFGENLFDSQRPSTTDHLFASVQSLNATVLEQFDPEHFDVIIIDEFHHAEATTYQRILEHFTPKELLGLTATPERADGKNVTSFFEGRIATELRLWDALEQDLLVPFHYFGIADETPLTDVSWRAGRYDQAQLSNIYTGNNARARIILRELSDKVSDIRQMTALGFCVSVEHARYMSEVFNQAGIPARYIVGSTAGVARDEALAQLRDGEIKIIFAVDVFNEGLDLPSIDTVLFLRPTESATIFLQQLGRGLRRAPDKAVLTVLDFVGQQNKNFRFDTKFRAITGSRRAIGKDVEEDFPFLPSGSHIVLDRVSKEIVLGNIRSRVLNARGLAAEIGELSGVRESIADYRLGQFLVDADRELHEIYRGTGTKRSWTSLKNIAVPGTYTDEEVELSYGAWRLAHVDDVTRAEKYRWLMREEIDYNELDDADKRWARMLYFGLIHPIVTPKKSQLSFTDYTEALDWLREQRALTNELDELFDAVLNDARITPRPTEIDSPLYAHARYTRAEILAALDIATWEKPRAAHVEGVQYCPAHSTDAFFINLAKSEKDFSPTTMYHDYAISPHRFHWESQSRTTQNSKDGQRYIGKKRVDSSSPGNGTHTMLFMRTTKNDPIGTAPFICLGTADLVRYTGEKPMQIEWELHEKMPEEWFLAAVAQA